MAWKSVHTRFDDGEIEESAFEGEIRKLCQLFKIDTSEVSDEMLLAIYNIGFMDCWNENVAQCDTVVI